MWRLLLRGGPAAHTGGSHTAAEQRLPARHVGPAARLQLQAAGGGGSGGRAGGSDGAAGALDLAGQSRGGVGEQLRGRGGRRRWGGWREEGSEGYRASTMTAVEETNERACVVCVQHPNHVKFPCLLFLLQRTAQVTEPATTAPSNILAPT